MVCVERALLPARDAPDQLPGEDHRVRRMWRPGDAGGSWAQGRRV